MNVETIEVLPQVAVQKLTEYRSLTARQRTVEDDALERMYAMLRKGGKVLDAAAAIRSAGLNEQGHPKLAIVRSDWPRVTCYSNAESMWFQGVSTDEPWNRSAEFRVRMGRGFHFPSRVFSPVPHIPADIRPKDALKNYYTLFEVEKWEQYPLDPILLKRIPKTTLFVVVAEWDLTPLEAAILAGLSR